MKNLVTFNPYRMDNMTPYQMLECMEERLRVANTVLDKLREEGCMSGRQLDDAVAKVLGAPNFTIRPYLEALAYIGFIRIEVRSEEYRKIAMDRADMGKTYPTHDPNCVIFVPHSCCRGPYLIYNPTVPSTVKGEYYVRGERMVQVRRKYYHWVG